MTGRLAGKTALLTAAGQGIADEVEAPALVRPLLSGDTTN